MQPHDLNNKLISNTYQGKFIPKYLTKKYLSNGQVTKYQYCQPPEPIKAFNFLLTTRYKPLSR